MIILGIDPGTAIIGYGVIEESKIKSQKLKIIDYGCITTTPDFSTAERLEKLHLELKKLIKKYKPDIVAVEDIFFFKNFIVIKICHLSTKGYLNYFFKS